MCATAPLKERNDERQPSFYDVMPILCADKDGYGEKCIAQLYKRYPHFDANAESVSFDNPVGQVTKELPYLHWACTCGYDSLLAAQRLVRCGADLRKKDYMGRTPLSIACHQHSQQSVKLVGWILAQPDGAATVNEVNSKGYGILHRLVYLFDSPCPYRCEVFRLLLRAGANPFMKNTRGCTPRQCLTYYTGLSVSYPQFTGTNVGKFPLAEKILPMLQRAEYAWDIGKLGEWRPHKQTIFPRVYRDTMRTLVILAKCRLTKEEKIALGLDIYVNATATAKQETIVSRYPSTCLELLPEELLQYLFTYVTTPHVPDAWIPEE